MGLRPKIQIFLAIIKIYNILKLPNFCNSAEDENKLALL